MRIVIEMTKEELRKFNCPSARVSTWIWQMLDGTVEPLLPTGLENLSMKALEDKEINIDVMVDLKLK